MRKLTHGEIVARQEKIKKQPRIPVTVVLNNIRSLYNVGSIFRTADGAGVEKIIICGITGHPPNDRIAKTALGAQDNVPWEYFQDIHSAIALLKKDKYQLLLLEQTQNSIPYQTFKPKGKVGLIVGNEIEGVTESIVKDCDAAIEIEMAGLKNSLNVAVAFG